MDLCEEGKKKANDDPAGTHSWLRLLIIGITTCLGALWLWYKGPVHVVRMTTPIEEFAPLWYMLSAFPVFGILLADLVTMRTLSYPSKAIVLFALQIGLIVVLSNARLGIRLPFSGHSLVMTYCLVRPRVLVSSLLHWSEFSFVFTLLIIVSYVKLVWWTDPITLFAGAAIGALIAFVGRAFTLRFD